MASITTGFHRIGVVTSLGSQNSGLNQEVVPGATIYVTNTATGAAATIYSDPLLSVQVIGSLLTANTSGAYDYYMPLNYLVTEAVSSPSGGLTTYSNIGLTGPLALSFTTTNSTSDVVSAAGILSTSHVALTPTNSSAATMIASVYVSAKNSGSITITHPATAGATFDLLITPY